MLRIRKDDRYTPLLILMGTVSLLFLTACESDDEGSSPPTTVTAPPSTIQDADSGADALAGGDGVSQNDDAASNADASSASDANTDSGPLTDTAADAQSGDGDAGSNVDNGPSSSDAEGDSVEDDVSTTPEPTPSPFPLRGVWESAEGQILRVSDTHWNDEVIAHLDLALDWLIVGRSDGSYDQLAWSWTDEGGFFACWAATGFSDFESALSTEVVVDDSAPSVMGCQGEAWDWWRETLEIAGAWLSGFGGWISITADSYGPSSVLSFDNEDNSLVLQNAATDPQAPGLYSKIVWTEPSVSGFYTCIIVGDAASLEDAEATSAEALDYNDPNAGCLGKPWTVWTPYEG